jgi:hypothetical protein
LRQVCLQYSGWRRKDGEDFRQPEGLQVYSPGQAWRRPGGRGRERVLSLLSAIVGRTEPISLTPGSGGFMRTAAVPAFHAGLLTATPLGSKRRAAPTSRRSLFATRGGRLKGERRALASRYNANQRNGLVQWRARETPERRTFLGQ